MFMAFAATSIRQQLPQLLATRADVLSPRMIRIIGNIVDDWRYLDERLERSRPMPLDDLLACPPTG